MLFDIFKKQEKNYTDLKAEAFKEGMQHKDAVIIDVRSSGEFRSGKIKGARNINLMSADFMEQIKHLPKDKEYYLYCRSGNRSGSAASVMDKQGFKKVYNLTGGIGSWPYEVE
ncbi:rhodanese-like domain-containing protein [Echinicola salinicaeni]|uniref:rhodanese-like domain-containing protein n=1 Tax=Echinicola salinicaeni TaxID=2762757 RepID=UPI0016465D57|nr:rhodanese-like domain-containing protein [Echinicola salinicaeni]